MIYTNYKGQKQTPDENDIVINRSGIWAAVFDSHDRLLVSRPEYDHSVIELPGGGIEEGEDKQHSLLREIEEEAGVSFDELDPIQTFTQHVKFLAWDKNEFWNYDQEYWIVKLDNSDDYFFGKRQTKENAFGEWIEKRNIKEYSFHHTHFEALKAMGVF